MFRHKKCKLCGLIGHKKEMVRHGSIVWGDVTWWHPECDLIKRWKQKCKTCGGTGECDRNGKPSLIYTIKKGG